MQSPQFIALLSAFFSPSSCGFWLFSNLKFSYFHVVGGSIFTFFVTAPNSSKCQEQCALSIVAKTIWKLPKHWVKTYLTTRFPSIMNRNDLKRGSQKQIEWTILIRNRLIFVPSISLPKTSRGICRQNLRIRN